MKKQAQRNELAQGLTPVWGRSRYSHPQGYLCLALRLSFYLCCYPAAHLPQRSGDRGQTGESTLQPRYCRRPWLCFPPPLFFQTKEQSTEL